MTSFLYAEIASRRPIKFVRLTNQRASRRKASWPWTKVTEKDIFLRDPSELVHLDTMNTDSDRPSKSLQFSNNHLTKILFVRRKQRSRVSETPTWIHFPMMPISLNFRRFSRKKSLYPRLSLLRLAKICSQTSVGLRFYNT